MNIAINGPKILFTLPFFGGISITETIVNSWIVMGLIALAAIWLTKGMTVHNPGKKQIVAETIVKALNGLVSTNMGEQWQYMMPYIGTVFAYSFVSSMLSITGLRSPTADFSVTLAMALITFAMVQFFNMKTKGPIGYITRFTKPVAVMTPLNVLSEVASPVSLSLRHFGNIASGLVITGLIYGSLAALSGFVLGWIPSTFLSNIPIFQAGIPAVLSIYFDCFTSALQAYIFCMLTMVYVSGAAE
ncbi:MAG: FoF1 ATP synthase subunit a [Oscillospiraceae bacterium]